MRICNGLLAAVLLLSLLSFIAMATLAYTTRPAPVVLWQAPAPVAGPAQVVPPVKLADPLSPVAAPTPPAEKVLRAHAAPSAEDRLLERLLN